ncbi:probable protein phosphatase DDB_G0282105 [Drosophila innubila]|uniref:probable protein phosphatase DDB_G0282105 n=1 Tax=Drosophila innubila TaxID=198719 RepID=UPI00148E05CC|nr:probable protein phosphatase DDB_G0282105 [Drosophila innubila]
MVIPRKSASSVSEAHRWDNNNMSLPAKSCESLFSGSSRESASQIYQRKQPVRGVKNGGMRQPSLVPSNTNTSDIHQRVMSARNLRAKTFQNQLADAQAEIANLAHENRMLRTMHKRQSTALNKYENTGAELPQLLHSHAEELRVWQTKHRNVQAANKELEAKLKQKEAQILTLSDQNRHFSQLIRDKNLDERQKLQDKLRTLEQRLQDKDNDMKLMSRKVQLESKNFRQQLLNEQKKTKEVMLKLEKARLEISGYRKLEEFAPQLDKANPLASARRTKLNAVEETDKIDKLEKSLEALDKAIEKNNQSEFNALTDVLETDSNFDFEKDDADEEKSVNQTTDALDKDKTKRGKLTLPPAAIPPKPLPNSSSVNASRLSLSQMLNQTKPKPNPRLRNGAAANGTVTGSGAGSLSSNLRSGRRRDGEDAGKVASVEGRVNKLQTMTKSLEFDYDDDSDHVDEDDDDDEGLISKMCHDDEPSDDIDEMNPNEDGPVNYAAYLDTKCELSEMLEMDEEEDDFDEDDEQSPKLMDNEKGNPRPVASMKENMSNIRKVISDDYKERENFLDIHCRPASGNNNNSNNMRDDPAKKKRNNNISTGGITGGPMAGSRKHALLAALKVIDDNKDED